ncbi:MULTISPECIES: hypothetical protein [unclassified Rhizobium]|uniref:hypothetical protein n=1 Tax=unclassified Rhizobium TaxID=2613769 RepID=UPI0013C4EC20|nr:MULTISPECIES: hypothetical protein [unclassified Rhizobium]
MLSSTSGFGFSAQTGRAPKNYGDLYQTDDSYLTPIRCFRDISALDFAAAHQMFIVIAAANDVVINRCHDCRAVIRRSDPLKGCSHV